MGQIPPAGAGQAVSGESSRAPEAAGLRRSTHKDAGVHVALGLRGGRVDGSKHAAGDLVVIRIFMAPRLGGPPGASGAPGGWCLHEWIDIPGRDRRGRLQKEPASCT